MKKPHLKTIETDKQTNEYRAPIVASAVVSHPFPLQQNLPVSRTEILRTHYLSIVEHVIWERQRNVMCCVFFFSEHTRTHIDRVDNSDAKHR